MINNVGRECGVGQPQQQRMVADEFGHADLADLLGRLRRLRESSDRMSDA